MGCCGDEAQRANLYKVLGVDIKATQDRIRQRYLTLARLWHPDRHQGSEVAKRKFQEILAAHEVLSCPSKRQQYDLGMLEMLDVEDYLSRYQGLILTVCGLGMDLSSATHEVSGDARGGPQGTLTLLAA